MNKTKKTKDDIRTPLDTMLRRDASSAGTDLSGAIRDLLTEVMHLCDDSGVDFEDRLIAAGEVYQQERAITHCIGEQDHER